MRSRMHHAAIGAQRGGLAGIADFITPQSNGKLTPVNVGASILPEPSRIFQNLGGLRRRLTQERLSALEAVVFA